MVAMEIDGTVFKEGNTFVVYTPKLDVSSCGNTDGEARSNLKTTIRLCLEEVEKMSTLKDILRGPDMKFKR